MNIRYDNRQELLSHFPKNSIGAELGVFAGDFSRQILKTVEPKTLYLVDIWKYQPNSEIESLSAIDVPNISNIDDYMKELHQFVKAEFSQLPNIRIRYELGAHFFQWLTRMEIKLDWIYIDANHSEDVFKFHLEMAREVVKPSGIIAGDDFHFTDASGHKTIKYTLIDFLDNKWRSKLTRFGQQWYFKNEKADPWNFGLD